MIVRQIHTVGKKKLSCISQNLEKYLTFSVDHLAFKDSLQFLPSSLESLVQFLRDDGVEKFQHLTDEFPDTDQRDLLLRKGVYPYSYVDSFKRFEERALPPKSAFRNDLSGEDISDEDYTHAQKVWDAFQMQTFGDYHDLYLKTDVLLLTSVFESFRDLSLTTYKLDPCWFVSSPGLSWQSMLKCTKVELELLTDPDMYLFFETGVRGGVSTISKKYAVANNKYLPDYDETKPSNYLMYLDANNL